MTPQSPHLYVFDRFCLDAIDGVLLSDGKRLPITPKAIHLLNVLIENRGRIVEKETLMQELWAGSFVEDGNLAFTIGQLRKTLGDKAHEPTFIETVPRRGYRFIADVRVPSEVGEAASSGLRKAVRTRSRVAMIGFGILSFCAVAIASWLLQSKVIRAGTAPPIFSNPFRAEKFSTENIAVATISPNGKLVAYVTETSGQYSLWLRRLETSESIQIVSPSDEPYFGLVFTHDNNSLYL